jgi:hypothetical protein
MKPAQRLPAGNRCAERWAYAGPSSAPPAARRPRYAVNLKPIQAPRPITFWI